MQSAVADHRWNSCRRLLCACPLARPHLPSCGRRLPARSFYEQQYPEVDEVVMVQVRHC